MLDILSLLLNGPGATQFTVIEQAALDSACKLLPEPYKSLALQQLKQYNLKDRVFDGKLVTMHSKKMYFITERVPNNLRFPEIFSEYRLAEVTFRSAETNTQVKASIWVLLGAIRSIHFTTPPKLLGQSFSILSTRMFANFATRTLDTTIDVPLPNDFLALVASGNLNVNGWQILDLSKDLYEIVLPDNNYYVLARKQAIGQIVIRSTDQSGALVFMNMRTDEDEPIQTSFLSFLQSYEC